MSAVTTALARHAVERPDACALSDGVSTLSYARLHDAVARAACALAEAKETVALALLDSGKALPGSSLDASGTAGTIVAKPFYRRRT